MNINLNTILFVRHVQISEFIIGLDWVTIFFLHGNVSLRFEHCFWLTDWSEIDIQYILLGKKLTSKICWLSSFCAPATCWLVGVLSSARLLGTTRIRSLPTAESRAISKQQRKWTICIRCTKYISISINNKKWTFFCNSWISITYHSDKTAWNLCKWHLNWQFDMFLWKYRCNIYLRTHKFCVWRIALWKTLFYRKCLGEFPDFPTLSRLKMVSFLHACLSPLCIRNIAHTVQWLCSGEIVVQNEIRKTAPEWINRNQFSPQVPVFDTRAFMPCNINQSTCIVNESEMLKHNVCGCTFDSMRCNVWRISHELWRKCSTATMWKWAQYAHTAKCVYLESTFGWRLVDMKTLTLKISGL